MLYVEEQPSLAWLRVCEAIINSKKVRSFEFLSSQYILIAPMYFCELCYYVRLSSGFNALKEVQVHLTLESSYNTDSLFLVVMAPDWKTVSRTPGTGATTSISCSWSYSQNY